MPPAHKPNAAPLEEHLIAGAAAEGLRFENADTERLRLTGASFENCHFQRCGFAGASFENVRFVKCRFVDCEFREARFSGCKFSDGDELSACQWFGCDFEEAAFEACNLSLNTLEKCKAAFAVFTSCSARESRSR